MIYVYVLRSGPDGFLYTGCTHDLRKRLDLHHRGKVVSTSERRPLCLIYYEACTNEQDARERVKSCYRCFGAGTSGAKDYSFRDQLQRAAISVMNNIAEGFERKTPKDFAHFLDLAKGSCGEVRSMFYVAEDLQYLTPESASEMREKAARLSAGIAAFTNHLRS